MEVSEQGQLLRVKILLCPSEWTGVLVCFAVLQCAPAGVCAGPGPGIVSLCEC